MSCPVPEQAPGPWRRELKVWVSRWRPFPQPRWFYEPADAPVLLLLRTLCLIQE